MPPPILIVEDDTTIATITAGYLESEGFKSEVVSNGREMMRRLRTRAYALVLLDLGLPDEDGLSLLRKLRGRLDIPVMVVTARNSIDARLAAFELGAQDVLTKPFDPRELRYRALNVIARHVRAPEPPREYVLGSWRIHLHAHTIHSTRTGKSAGLTRTEFDLLAVLLRGGGRVFSRAQLIDAVTGVSDPESDRAIDILVSRLRKKLASDGRGSEARLVTVRGTGYRLPVDDSTVVEISASNRGG
ncbi:MULTISPECIES: response regulator transcription factor [Paraburkholderia]|uniref:Response regulator transcription factor n=1 Tax=Paraburkholderia podalyriae TaxID=1938811 RepID=A0ABR7PSK9_9BURK|nr:response regulator transcription factor [Paraburkholderia podalyriae]MBC8749279.1 response regulator transcription factor [Paraburkholderia podalyriae]